MTASTPLRDIPQHNIFRKGDTFVLFGELFGRGYANGLVNEGRKAGMAIKRITGGRRAQIDKCRGVGVQRVRDSVSKVMAQLDGMIPDGSNAFFAHTMAGGIPKVKVFLAIANRIYKGRGERFMSSRALLDSDLGKLCLVDFDEVTANTFQYLIEGRAAIRARLEKTGGQARSEERRV